MSPSLEELLSRFDAGRPLAQADTIPARWYREPDLHEAERLKVFGNTWQMVGRADQLVGPGSFFTADVAGEPLVVVRDNEGVLRAFYNVCRHRAGRVVCAGQGHLTRLRCRYHGWTYDLAGNLRGVPEFDGVEGFARESNGLVPVHVDTWGPFAFVHLGPAPGALADLLAPWAQRTAALDTGSLRFVSRREYTLQCNWKVFVDNYLDGGYHVNSVHPGLAGVLDYAHYRTEIEGEVAIQISPLVAGNAGAGAGVGPVRSGENAYYGWIFPNLMLNLYAGVMDTNLVLPTGPESCRVIFDFYFSQTEGPTAAEFIRASTEVAHQVQMEDAGVCEEVQRGLGSRSYDTGRFSVRREAAGYFFHQMLARRLRQP